MQMDRNIPQSEVKRITTLFFVLGIVLNAFSQSFIIGNVQDAFLKYPLPEAKVSLLLAADSTVVIDSIPIRNKYNEDGTIRKAEFSIKMERKTSVPSWRGAFFMPHNQAGRVTTREADTTKSIGTSRASTGISANNWKSKQMPIFAAESVCLRIRS